VLHHHSYAYLRGRSFIAALLTRAVGTHGLHVVLCRDMERKLKDLYQNVHEVLTLSNAAFVELAGGTSEPRKRLGHIGYISNVSAEKGIFTFLDVMERLANSKTGDGVKASIAGPFGGNEV